MSEQGAVQLDKLINRNRADSVAKSLRRSRINRRTTAAFQVLALCALVLIGIGLFSVFVDVDPGKSIVDAERQCQTNFNCNADGKFPAGF